MNILFVHQNFPGQYLHLASLLGAIPGNRVVFITQRRHGELRGVEKVLYQPNRRDGERAHHYLRDVEAHVLNAQAVARAALKLKKSGFVPDLMIGHNKSFLRWPNRTVTHKSGQARVAPSLSATI